LDKVGGGEDEDEKKICPKPIIMSREWNDPDILNDNLQTIPNSPDVSFRSIISNHTTHGRKELPVLAMCANDV
tara:strand:+ start:459 stop:677 length:219 start_codon:yes stop_codon:yes gene_type:complete